MNGEIIDGLVVVSHGLHGLHHQQQAHLEERETISPEDWILYQMARGTASATAMNLIPESNMVMDWGWGCSTSVDRIEQ
jgi:hypothetical protein